MHAPQLRKTIARPFWIYGCSAKYCIVLYLLYFLLSGLVPLPGAGIYTATKYGIVGFMEALRAELRLSDCDYVKTTIANTYMMKTSGELHLLSDAG